MPKKHVVRFKPDGKEATVEEDESIFEAASKADAYIESVCGGLGECGKCKVIVTRGEYTGGKNSYLPDVDAKKGMILSCIAKAKSDIDVLIPEESREGMHQILTRSEFAWLAELDSPVKKYHLVLSKPTITDNIGDFTRLRRSLKDLGCDEAGISIDLLRNLGNQLRQDNWDVTATVAEANCGKEIIALDGSDTASRCFGIAIDIGTTTIVAELIDLVNGNLVDAEAALNRQISSGEEILSRMLFVEEGGLEKLRTQVVETINHVISELIARNEISADDVVGIGAAGNTVMTQLFLGLDTRSIRSSPFIPWINYLPQYKAKEVGIGINPNAFIYASPCRSSYVGGDITADILASSLHKSKKLSMLIDVGTNGEVVLGNRDWMVSASCSAGPAFEGGEVACGIRAMVGAIERVELDDDGKISYKTIGNAKAKGVCGSGLIDLIAELFSHKIIDKSGKFQPSTTSNIRDGRDGKEYVIAGAEETSVDRDLTISQVDINNIIRTKAAMFAAGRYLLVKTGFSFNDVEQLFICGGFGNYLDTKKAILIGLLPDLGIGKYKFIGNGSVAGARLLLLSRTKWREADEIVKRLTYIELSADSNFYHEFTSASFLPHTDMSLFPSLRNTVMP